MSSVENCLTRVVGRLVLNSENQNMFYVDASCTIATISICLGSSFELQRFKKNQKYVQE